MIDELMKVKVVGASFDAFDTENKKVTIYLYEEEVLKLIDSVKLNAELNDVIRTLRDALEAKTKALTELKIEHLQLVEDTELIKVENSDMLADIELLNRENKALEDDNYQKCSLNEELANTNKKLKKENEQLLERIKRLEA